MELSQPLTLYIEGNNVSETAGYFFRHRSGSVSFPGNEMTNLRAESFLHILPVPELDPGRIANPSSVKHFLSPLDNRIYYVYETPRNVLEIACIGDDHKTTVFYNDPFPYIAEKNNQYVKRVGGVYGSYYPPFSRGGITAEMEGRFIVIVYIGVVDTLTTPQYTEITRVFVNYFRASPTGNPRAAHGVTLPGLYSIADLRNYRTYLSEERNGLGHYGPNTPRYPQNSELIDGATAVRDLITYLNPHTGKLLVAFIEEPAGLDLESFPDIQPVPPELSDKQAYLRYFVLSLSSYRPANNIQHGLITVPFFRLGPAACVRLQSCLITDTDDVLVAYTARYQENYTTYSGGQPVPLTAVGFFTSLIPGDDDNVSVSPTGVRAHTFALRQDPSPGEVRCFTPSNSVVRLSIYDSEVHFIWSSKINPDAAIHGKISPPLSEVKLLGSQAQLTVSGINSEGQYLPNLHTYNYYIPNEPRLVPSSFHIPALGVTAQVICNTSGYFVDAYKFISHPENQASSGNISSEYNHSDPGYSKFYYPLAEVNALPVYVHSATARRVVDYNYCCPYHSLLLILSDGTYRLLAYERTLMVPFPISDHLSAFYSQSSYTVQGFLSMLNADKNSDTILRDSIASFFAINNHRFPFAPFEGDINRIFVDPSGILITNSPFVQYYRTNHLYLFDESNDLSIIPSRQTIPRIETDYNSGINLGTHAELVDFYPQKRVTKVTSIATQNINSAIDESLRLSRISGNLADPLRTRYASELSKHLLICSIFYGAFTGGSIDGLNLTGLSTQQVIEFPPYKYTRFVFRTYTSGPAQGKPRLVHYYVTDMTNNVTMLLGVEYFIYNSNGQLVSKRWSSVYQNVEE